MSKTQTQIQVKRQPRKSDEPDAPPVTKRILKRWFDHTQDGDQK
jgi:hypothetical protein